VKDLLAAAEAMKHKPAPQEVIQEGSVQAPQKHIVFAQASAPVSKPEPILLTDARPCLAHAKKPR